MEKLRCYAVDLTKIGGSGDFRCPKCRIKISPDDETEKAYSILETETKAERLESIILQCKKCGVLIRLVGFDLLNERE